MSSEGCPVKHEPASSSASSGCPVKSDDKKNIDEGYNTAANDLSYNQHRQPDQIKNMSTVRPVSGIPKSTYTPGHQFANVDRWVYPSEQQYYNAMKKKGYHPAEDDMPVILAIHNIVNEQGWSKVKEWESLRGCQNPKLKQFLGRPKDISPKAYLMNMIGYKLPFDRHDWVIDRDGKEVRYVIDFYTGAKPQITEGRAPISIHLDVRPALDSFQAVADRVSVQYRSFIGKPSFTMQKPIAPPASAPVKEAAKEGIA